MELRLVLHATLQLAYHGIDLLIDPMLSPPGALDPVSNSSNQRRNPLVQLPFAAEELDQLVSQVGAILVTHTHFDHWDGPAQARLPKNIPVFCQPEDAAQIGEAGFQAVFAIEEALTWQGIHITRRGGQHGTGSIGRRMGPVSGFVLVAAREPVIYIAGDTIWCDEVEQAIDEHKPDIIVVNAGAAQFSQGDPITMDAAAVERVCQAAPEAQIFAVHMEAINHCLLSRRDLSQALEGKVASNHLTIPDDGQRHTLEL